MRGHVWCGILYLDHFLCYCKMKQPWLYTATVADTEALSHTTYQWMTTGGQYDQMFIKWKVHRINLLLVSVEHAEDLFLAICAFQVEYFVCGIG